MKKAKAILASIMVLAVVGGIFAFKAKKFTPFPVFITTTAIYITENGVTYATFGNLCTTNGKFITPQGPQLVNVHYLNLAQPSTVWILTAVDGSPRWISRTFYPCLPTLTFTTTAW